MFKNSATVRRIKKEITVFQGNVEELGKSTLSCIEYSNEKYRKISTTLYKQGQQIRNEILESEMYQFYSKLFTAYHIGDLSIISAQSDTDLVSVCSDLSQSSYLTSDSRSTVTSDESAGIVDLVNRLREEAKLKESELKKIIEVRNIQISQYEKIVGELGQYKQRVEELSKEVKMKNKKIKKLQKQSKDAIN